MVAELVMKICKKEHKNSQGIWEKCAVSTLLLLFRSLWGWLWSTYALFPQHLLRTLQNYFYTTKLRVYKWLTEISCPCLTLPTARAPGPSSHCFATACTLGKEAHRPESCTLPPARPCLLPGLLQIMTSLELETIPSPWDHPSYSYWWRWRQFLGWCSVYGDAGGKPIAASWGQSPSLLGPHQERDISNFLPLPRIKTSAILTVSAKAAGHRKRRNVKPNWKWMADPGVNQSFSFPLWKPPGCRCVHGPYVHANTYRYSAAPGQRHHVGHSTL